MVLHLHRPCAEFLQHGFANFSDPGIQIRFRAQDATRRRIYDV
jgi:hypothetical protein